MNVPSEHCICPNGPKLTHWTFGAQRRQLRNRSERRAAEKKGLRISSVLLHTGDCVAANAARIGATAAW